MSDVTAASRTPEDHPRFRTAARTFAAVWYGVFVTAAASALTTPLEGGFGIVGVIAAAALTVFSVVSSVGICRWEERLPRYGFAASSVAVAWLIPAEWRVAAALFSVLPLVLWFRFGSRWRGSHCEMLMLAVVAALFLDLNPLCDVALPESAYLPVSLLVDKPRVRMLAVGEDIPRDWWRDVGFAGFVADGPADVAIAGTGADAAVLSWLGKYGMVSRGGMYRRGMYRFLIDRLTADGVLVMPRRDLPVLPFGDWRFSPLPGAPDDWLAARRGQAPVTDPEELDKRLQAHEHGDDPLLPSGAFAALYYAPQVRPVRFERQPEHRVPFGAWKGWFWGGALLYFCIRVWLCLRERTSTLIAALENTLIFSLLTLGAVRPLGEAEFLLGIPPQLLFAGLGLFLLPLRPDTAGAALMNTLGAAALLLVLGFPDSAAVLWVCWFVAALSGAALRERLAAESPRLAAAGSCIGLAAGVGIYALLLVCGADTFRTVMTICIVFRAGLYFRHWRKIADFA